MFIKTHANIKPFVLVEHEGFQYLGLVRNGLQIGALALTPEGCYVQVNGAIVQRLNEYQVVRALRMAKQVGYESSNLIPSRPVAQPLVTWRRRRRLSGDAAIA